MTTSLFKITPTPPTSIELGPGQEGKFSFTVESLAAPGKVHEVMLQALLVGEDGKGEEVDWLVAGPERTLSMSGGKTATVVVAIRPTPSSPRGPCSVKLVIADRDRPNDVYADSPVVACDVKAPAEAPKPRRRFPLWLIAAIVGGVLVVGGTALILWMLLGKDPGPGGLGEACDAASAAACDEGLVCAPGVGKCLLAGGAACKPAEAAQCASGECVSGRDICAAPLGAACDAANRDAAPCPKDALCDPATKTCLGGIGARCRINTECATGACINNACATGGGISGAGAPCSPEGLCPSPMQCSAAKICVEQTGRPCSKNIECATGLCERNVCAEPALLRDCTADNVCGADQKCVEFQPGIKRCLWRPGHACAGNGECSSNWCNRGICSRDDGKCDDPGDCPSPYICITAKQRCLKPVNAVCGGNAECDSDLCRNNRCVVSGCDPPCQGFFLVCNNAPVNPRCVPRAARPREHIPFIFEPDILRGIGR